MYTVPKGLSEGNNVAALFLASKQIRDLLSPVKSKAWKYGNKNRIKTLPVFVNTKTED